MKKILIITYYWPPSGGAGVQRWLKFVKYMPLFNVTPIVLTIDPAKAEYPIIDFSLNNDISPNLQVITTNGKSIYNIYKRFTKAKTAPYGGFANEGTPSFKQKISRFIRGNFFIPDPRKGWNKYAYKEALRIIQSEQIDTIITTGPPHSTHLIGQKLKKQLKINWIADFRDPWTDIYYYKLLYPTAIARIIDKKIEKHVIENCDALIAVSPDLIRLFQEKTIMPIHDKVHIITNGYDEEDFLTKNIPTTNNSFVITYTGTIAQDYTIDNFIKAIQETSKIKNIKIRFIGQVDSTIKYKLERDLGNIVEFIPHIPHEKSIEYLQNSDALLLIISNTPNNKGILTGKIFEYLGARKPIICIGPEDGDAAKIIDECDAGYTIDYNDLSKSIKVIENLILNNYSFQFNVQKYNRQEQTKQLCAIFDSLI